MLKKVNDIKFYRKIACQLLGGDSINEEDYQHAYNKVAPTYNLWLERMGQYTDRIIKPTYFPEGPLTILDLACGTGYISQQLLERYHIEGTITSVDISEGMLDQMAPSIKNKVKQVNQDVLSFLRETEARFDLIFCGWALPYFDHHELLDLCQQRLKPNGIMGVISNSQGTLKGIENIFLKTMRQYPEEVQKPMDIRFKLVKDKTMLKKWFKQYDFKAIEVGEDEVAFSFDSPEGLYHWVMSTGAIAGTKEIFNQYRKIEPSLVQGIGQQTYKDGQFWINHKFVYGIFQYCPSRSL